MHTHTHMHTDTVEHTVHNVLTQGNRMMVWRCFNQCCIYSRKIHLRKYVLGIL